MIKLRPYQIEAVNKISNKIDNGERNTLLHLPTGTGKTEIIIELTKRNIAKKQGTAFIMRRRHLVMQGYKRMSEAIHPALCSFHMANKQTYSSLFGNYSCYVVSFDTLLRRPALKALLKSKCSLFVFDEAHDCTSEKYQDFLKEATDKFCLGVTATPYKINGKFHDFWDSVIRTITEQKAIDSNYLSKMKFYCPPLALSKKKLRKGNFGDYTTDSMFTEMDKKKIYGDFERYFRDNALNKNSIIFCVNIEHSKKIFKIVEDMGVKNIFRIDHHLAHSEQKEIRSDISDCASKKENFCIINVNMFSTGIDIPSLEVAFMLRPTKSTVLWDQQIGRLSRIYPDKESARIFDMVGNANDLGTPYTEDRYAELTGKSKEPQSHKFKICSKCFLQVAIHLKQCPECGYEFGVNKRGVIKEDKSIQLIDYALLLKKSKDLDISSFEYL